MEGDILDRLPPDIIVTMSSPNSVLISPDDYFALKFINFFFKRFVFSSIMLESQFQPLCWCFWNWSFSFSRNQIHCLLFFNGFLNIRFFLIFKFLAVGADIGFANIETCSWSVKFCKCSCCCNTLIKYFWSKMLLHIFILFSFLILQERNND